MALDTPTLQAIITRARADFRSETGIDPLRRSIESALIRALAGMARGLYGFLSWIFRQTSPATADETYGWRWAAIWDVVQKPATAWEGTVTFTGVDTTNVPSGTVLTRSDGYEYETTVGGNIGDDVSGELTVAAIARSTFEGFTGNNEDGAVLTLATPIADVASEVTVASTTNAGEDLETWADGLVRLLERIQGQGDGGTTGFYVNAALEVSGVTRAWEYSVSGGSVDVAFVRDNDGTGSAILPDSTERDEVQDAVQAAAPITVTIGVVTLTANTVNFDMSATPNTSAVRSAIKAELQDFFVREAEPGVTLDLSRINAAISSAAGETSHVLVSPAADVTSTASQMPILGTVTVNSIVV